MSTRPPTNIPMALSRARRQFDHWRSQQPNKRARLPKELWQQAVALAQEHGLNKTARALGLKYDSLKKHLEAASTEISGPQKARPAFLELLPEALRPASLQCTITLDDGSVGAIQMRVQGIGVGDLVALMRMLRENRA